MLHGKRSWTNSRQRNFIGYKEKTFLHFIHVNVRETRCKQMKRIRHRSEEFRLKLVSAVSSATGNHEQVCSRCLVFRITVALRTLTKYSKNKYVYMVFLWRGKILFLSRCMAYAWLCCVCLIRSVVWRNNIKRGGKEGLARGVTTLTQSHEQTVVAWTSGRTHTKRWGLSQLIFTCVVLKYFILCWLTAGL